MTVSSETFKISILILFSLCIFSSPAVNSDEHSIRSKFAGEQVEKKRCNYNLKMLWHTDVGTSPFAATPLIADIDGDKNLEIAAAPFSETITVLDGGTGKPLEKSSWPLHNLESTIHASPLQYDIDGDGLLDILLVTTSGEIIFYRHDGVLLSKYSYQLPQAYVLSHWYHQRITIQFEDINKFVSEEGGRDHIGVDVHVYATPVLIDINRDRVVEELVVPTTYMFVEEDYDLPPENGNKFVVGGVTIVNLTALFKSRHNAKSTTISTQYFFELTQVLSEFPAFNLYSPTIIDLDGDGGELEIISALSTGNIHVFAPSAWNTSGQRKGFPLTHSTIHGQVTVTDVDSDGSLELIAIDTSGNVICFNADGRVRWTAEVSGSSSPGCRVADTNMDGILDIIIPTNEGDIYVYNGTDGHLLPRWPFQTGKRIAANVMVTRLSPTKGPPDIVFVADDGNLYIIAGDHSCEAHIALEESSLVEVMAHDLIPLFQGLELLVSTKDGSIICLGSSLETAVEDLIEDSPRKNLLFRAWPSSLKSPNDFAFSELKPFIYIRAITRDQPEITGTSFELNFDIEDLSKPLRKQLYNVAVYYGCHLMVQQDYEAPGSYQLTVPLWPEPGMGHVTVVLTNQHGQIAVDSLSLKFNQLILQDIQWLVLAPFVAMVTILLVNHGFPAKDLLPVSFPTKKK